MAKAKKSSPKKMTMKQFEGSKMDKKADSKMLSTINKKKK